MNDTGTVRVAAVAPSTVESLISIQCLRGVAALLVVVTHVIGGYNLKYPGHDSVLIGLNYLKDLGASGVDIFFVISGFIMVYVNQRQFSSTAGIVDFLMRRIIRIVPLYWIITTVMILLLLFWPSIFSTLKFDLRHVVESYLFIPTMNSNDEYFPVLNAGWTLSYEMYFYFIFAVLLVFSARASIVITAAFFSASVVAGLLWPSGGPVSYMLTHQLLLEFVVGEFLGLWFISGGRLDRKAAAALFAATLAFYLYHLVYGPLGAGRFIDRGIAGAALVCSLVFMERNGQVSFPNWLKKIGDSSYSLYLIHTLIIATFFKLCELAGLIGHLPADLVMVVGILAAVIGAHVAYLLLERPITRSLIRMWRRSSRRDVATA